MTWKLFVHFFGFFFIFKQTVAFLGGSKGGCAGHEVISEFVRDCKGSKNPHGTIHNFSFTLNDECEMTPNVCVKWKKVDADTVEYDITVKEGKKQKFAKKGKASICEGFQRQDYKDAQQTYPILKPYDCDLSKVKDKEGMKCITKGKTKLNIPFIVWGIAKGIVSGEVWIYDTKAPDIRSCYQFEVLVDYKKSG